MLIHFSCQLHTEWGKDLFPPLAEPSLSTESNPAQSLLGSFSVLHFYSEGIFFFFAHEALSCEYVISLSHFFFLILFIFHSSVVPSDCNNCVNILALLSP